MKNSRTTILIIALLIFSLFFGYLIFGKGISTFSALELFIFSLTLILAVIVLFKAFTKFKEEKEGQPAEDEFSNLVKYKAGYYAYMTSMYMWLFIFLFRDRFSDTETMLGGGILLSGLIALLIKFAVKRSLHDQ